MKETLSHAAQLKRKILLGLGALTALPLLPSCGFRSSESERWLSAVGDQEQSYGLGSASQVKAPTFQPTGFRGHGLAQNPANPIEVIIVARRPGNMAMVFNTQSKTITHRLTSPAHLFMEGHACYSIDGRFLYCTQSHRDSSQGVISVWDTRNYTFVTQFPSGGIGPHELIAIPNSSTLAIANGGLIKNPDGTVVNGKNMATNLTLLDTYTGQINQVTQGLESKASIRHLDVSTDGIIAIAMQAQRKHMKHNELIALTALQKPGNNMVMLEAPSKLIGKLNDYVGSVRINNKYRTAAFTSPRGDLALFWNIDSAQFLGHHFFHNVCGLTVSQDQEFFVLSNSAGKIRKIHGQSLIEDRGMRLQFPELQWDNHLITVAAK